MAGSLKHLPGRYGRLSICKIYLLVKVLLVQPSRAPLTEGIREAQWHITHVWYRRGQTAVHPIAVLLRTIYDLCAFLLNCCSCSNSEEVTVPSREHSLQQGVCLY